MASDINFAKQVKNELTSQKYTIEQKKAILTGFIRSSGTLSLGKVPTLHLRTEIASVAKLIFSAFNDCYEITSKIAYENMTRFRKGIAYQITITSAALNQILEELEVIEDGFERMPLKETLKNKYFKYLLVGYFLASGSINNPSLSKTSYFLEMAFNDKKDAQAIKRKLCSFKEERTMNFKMIERRNKFVLYLKRSDQISVFLSFIGAHESMFAFENARIMKEDININNRLTICDTANYGKTISVSQKDIEDINLLLQHKPLSLFDEKTQMLINMRLEYKDANYRELAEKMTEKGIKITKSGVYHILNNIREDVKKIKEHSNQKDY